MKDIKLLSKMIDDELDGAEEYIRHALLCQGKNPELAKPSTIYPCRRWST